MRVLVVGEAYPDSFADNVETSLRDGGHQVRVVSPFPPALSGRGRLTTRLRGQLPRLPRVASAIQRGVVHAAEDFRPEIVLSLDYRLAWRAVPEIRRLGAPCAFWFPDALGNLGLETHVLAGYDAVFVTDTAVARRYRDLLRLNAHFLPEACNPRWHRPTPNVSPGDDGPVLLVAGNLYATRFMLLRHLAEAGVPFCIYGPAWPGWLPQDPRLRRGRGPRYLARHEKARSFRGAFAVLNSMMTHEGDGANCRLFEAAGCGAVVLTEERPQLPTLFDPHEEVTVYSSLSELLARIDALRSMSVDERRARGDAAARRAHGEHTYLHRFERIIDVLGRG